MKKLYLVDVSSIFFRAFYAVRSLTSPAGMPTNAIYGFMSMIVKLLKEEKPDYLGFCYDLPTPSFRKEIYPDYKAHRTETPPDLIPQIPYIKKIVDALGIPSFEVEGYEADDIIGTLTEVGIKHHCQVVIVSGDKDFGQLVRSGVQIFDTMKDVRIDADGVKAKWGIRPDQFIDYLSLIGDTSDNIPGVEGIGAKTAEKLLNDYGNLENIYKNIETIKSASLRAKLLKGHDSALLSKKLVTINTHIPIIDRLEMLRPSAFKKEELLSILRELNFKTFEKSLFSQTSESNDAVENKSSISVEVNNQSIVTHDEFGIPVTTTVSSTDSLRSNGESSKSSQKSLIELIPTYDNLELIREGSEVWVFFNGRGHYLVNNDYLWTFNSELIKWGEVLSRKNLIFSGFDLKSFWKDLGISKIKSSQIKWDSQLAAYLIKTDEVGSFSETVSEFLIKNIPPFCSPSDEYQFHQELFLKLQKEIEHQNLHQLLYELEFPISPILLSMEQEGVLLDIDKLSKQSLDLEIEISTLEKEILSLCGESFNISSPKQLSAILFDKLGLPVGKKTKTGYSTDNEVLENLREAHPVIKYILDFRELTKLKSTYVDALPLLAHPITHRIHTHFNQALTSTGRLSSTNPNLQNIPIKTQRGQAIRKTFIAPDGCDLLSLDYSQIELRILAHITEDPGLCRAFSEGQDIHSATASEVFNVSIDQVTTEMRRAAKAINFGIAYGQGAYGLAENLGVSRTEAQQIIKNYFTRFQGVQNYMESTISDAKKNGFVISIFGRKRILRELKSTNPVVRKFGERAAINAPIQGASSDIVKKAMIAVNTVENAKLILQVHDELLFECKSTDSLELIKVLKNKMENVVRLKVPLIVNGCNGKNWDEAH